MSDPINEGDMVTAYSIGFNDYGIVKIINGPFARVKFGRQTVACRLADLTLAAKKLRGAYDEGSDMETCGVEG